MVQHIVQIHGLPVVMVSDRGPQFSSSFWKVFCTLIGSSDSLSSDFHQQSNGQSERANQDLEKTLCCLIFTNPTNQRQELVSVENSRHTLRSSAMGLSPFKCTLGCQPPLFPAQEEEVPYDDIWAYHNHNTITHRLDYSNGKIEWALVYVHIQSLITWMGHFRWVGGILLNAKYCDELYYCISNSQEES
jgi:hypothetical protein